MKYTRVYLDAIGYELAPVVVTTEELEARLRPLYDKLRLPPGQLEAVTGISERRWWEQGYSVAQGAAAAARKALAVTPVRPDDLDILIYAGVCREYFEPATACHVAAEVGVGPDTEVYDISNACLAVMNGIVDIANRIELGQARAGLVVSCETAREINEAMIERLLHVPDLEQFKLVLATFTGGSGAVAVLVTDGSFGMEQRRRLVGGVARTAPQFHLLCRWGLLDGNMPSLKIPFTATDSAAVLKNGVELGTRTWQAFLNTVGWIREQVDKVICHQVGAGHREAVLQAIGLSADKDFPTYPYLGNIGTVSLPLTAALAEEREFLRPGDRVGFLGIGSGLNCLMLGLEW
ncbi:MAG: 3-oxoacyl-ACP synthase III [Gemmataceae bacterium]